MCKLLIAFILIILKARHGSSQQIQSNKEIRQERRLSLNEIQADNKMNVAAANLEKVRAINEVRRAGLKGVEKASAMREINKNFTSNSLNLAKMAALEKIQTRLNAREKIVQGKFQELITVAPSNPWGVTPKGFIPPSQFDNVASQQICNDDNPCPENFVCRYSNILSATQTCVPGDSSNEDLMNGMRPGKCPMSDMSDMQIPTSLHCNDHKDCENEMRCCPISLMNKAVCMDPVSVDSRPTVTAIVVGYTMTTDDGMYVVGSSTLVQCDGFNVLVDTSAIRTNLLPQLWEAAGLVVQDINMIVETHGHSDHLANVGMFPNIDHVSGIYLYNGPMMRTNPLAEGEKYYLNGDMNVEVIQTPGHTTSDVSVIVRNVPGYGTVSIVGDLILSQMNMGDSLAVNVTKANENRKIVVCMSDYIVPGHGEMFQVNATLQKQFNCMT